MLKYYNVMNSQNNDDGKFHHFESASMFHQFLSNISYKIMFLIIKQLPYMMSSETLFVEVKEHPLQLSIHTSKKELYSLFFCTHYKVNISYT